jgi:hypothetical protein
MKRLFSFSFGVSVCLALACAASAQMGMNLFKKPNIANIFRPVVGSGAAYQMIDSEGKKSSLELSIVDKELFEGKTAYWFEVGHDEERTGTMSYAKMLVTPDDFQFHRMIFVMPGSNQPVEMPFNPSQRTRQRMQEEMEKWHSVGTESVTVPAGTFSCEHWTRDDGKGDVWVSTKVSPMSLVKSVDKNSTMVLTRLFSDAKDHIAGTPQKFDPQMMRQMMQQRMGKDQE